MSLEVPDGDIRAVTGPNGAGKTSLLRAVSGLLAFHGGRVTGGRVDVDGSVGYVLEGRRVFRDLTVEENVRAGAFPVRDNATAKARVAWAWERFPGLAARRTVRAGHLSGGEQQLLSIARAMVPSPRVLLLDEPTVGLAAEAVVAVHVLVRELAATGTAVLVAEQEPVLARGVPGLGLAGGQVVARVVAPA